MNCLYNHPSSSVACTNSLDIDFVVLSGAGKYGAIYAGVYKALYEQNILNSIKYWCGTSAGAIASTFIACGMPLNFCINQMLDTDVSKFYDVGGVITPGFFSSFRKYLGYTELVSNWGVARGNAFFLWLENMIVSCGYSRDCTFAELYNLSGNHLCITTTSLTINRTLFLSRSSVPNMKIVDALYASCALPGIFQPIIYEDMKGTKHILNDGGTLGAFPLHAVDILDSDGNVIGINRRAIGIVPYYNTNISCTERNNKISNLFQYSTSVLNCLYVNLQRSRNTSKYYRERIISIDTADTNSLDFALTQRQKMECLTNGYIRTKTYCEERRTMIEQYGHLPSNLFIPNGCTINCNANDMYIFESDTKW